MSSYMRIRFSVLNIAHRRSGNVKQLTDSVLGHASTQGTNTAYLARLQAAPPSPLSYRVVHIIHRGPRKQMLRITARWVITLVAGKEPMRQQPFRQFIRNSVSLGGLAIFRVCLAANMQLPIASAVSCSPPWPARTGSARLIDLRPEIFSKAQVPRSICAETRAICFAVAFPSCHQLATDGARPLFNARLMIARRRTESSLVDPPRRGNVKYNLTDWTDEDYQCSLLGTIGNITINPPHMYIQEAPL